MISSMLKSVLIPYVPALLLYGEQYFLPLASVSNVGKAMALAAFVATAPAFQQALCTGGNIADVTAKGQVWVGAIMYIFLLGFVTPLCGWMLMLLTA